MGGFFSKYYHGDETNDENYGRFNVSKVTQGRKTVVDPRSPSTEILRTPIQVEVTPKHHDAVRKISPLVLAPLPECGAGETHTSVTDVKHQRIANLQLQGGRDPRSPSHGIARTPLQVVMDEDMCEQSVEQVQEILLYEGSTEVPLIKNSPMEAAHPSCARIMGLSPQGVQSTDAGQKQLDADIDKFLSGLSKALSLTEIQQQKVMRTYRGRENSVRTKKLQLAKQKVPDNTPPPRVRVPLSDVNSTHQMWRGRSGKEDRYHLSLLSENTPPSSMHDTSKLHAVWDQDATVVI